MSIIAKAADVMAKVVVTTTRNNTVADARRQMLNLGIHALPVVSAEGVVEGIVSTTDILRAERPDMPISDVMSSLVFVVAPTSTAYDAVDIMLNHHIHHVLVIDAGRVAGIISSFDLLGLVPRRQR